LIARVFAEQDHKVVIPPEPTIQRKKKRYLVPVLHLSDQQWGKITESYNPEIAHERMMRLVEVVGQLIETHRSHSTVDTIRIYLGGDIIEGHDIFPGQGQQILYGSYKQAKYVSMTLASMILGFLRFVRKVYVKCVPGNHGRIGKDDPDSNWDTQTYDLIKLRLSKVPAARLDFPDPGPWYQVDRVLGWGNLIVHGHQINGFSQAAIAKKAQGWIDSIPEPWDYLFVGHFHTLSSCVVNNRITLTNGSPESDNTYAQETMAATGSPVQRLCFFDRKHGMIADHPIYLGERVPNRK